MDSSNHYGTYIKQIHDTLERLANNDLREKDLTISQSQLLLHLASAKNGECSLKELEKLLKVAQSSAAGIVLRLEQKGFVEGYISSDDKRVKFARITDNGRTVCEKSLADIEHTERQVFGSLTPDESALFLTLLKKICARFQLLRQNRARRTRHWNPCGVGADLYEHFTDSA